MYTVELSTPIFTTGKRYLRVWVYSRLVYSTPVTKANFDSANVQARYMGREYLRLAELIAELERDEHHPSVLPGSFGNAWSR